MKWMHIVLAWAVLAVAVLPATAQKKNKDADNKRSVQGVVLDKAENPLEGAVVQLKDTKSLQIRSFITRTNGTYHFTGLSADVDYELRADHQGKASGQKTLSSFDSRKQAVMNLKIDK